MGVATNRYQEIQRQTEYETRGDVTLRDALMRYVESKAGTEGGTYVNIKYRAEKIIGECKGKQGTFHLDGHMPMSKLRTKHVAVYKEARQREGLKPATINTEIRCLQRAYTLCRDEWGINVDPNVRFTSMKTKPKTRYLSDSEERQVRADLDGQALALFEVLIGSGVRLREGTGLEWPNVDFDSKTLEVYRSKTGRWAKVPLTDRAAAALRLLLEQERPFPTPEQTITTLRRTIHRNCNSDPRREKATIHSLRDTFATRLVSRGMSLYMVSKLLGHSSLSMSMKYAHMEGSDLTSKALELLQ